MQSITYCFDFSSFDGHECVVLYVLIEFLIAYCSFILCRRYFVSIFFAIESHPILRNKPLQYMKTSFD